MHVKGDENLQITDSLYYFLHMNSYRLCYDILKFFLFLRMQ